MKIERIEWYDSYGVEGAWQEADDVKISDFLVITVGEVVKENKRYLVVASSVAPETPQTSRQNCGRMFIYKKCITKRKILK